MIASTLVAATLAAAQPQPAQAAPPAPAAAMDHSKMNQSATGAKPAAKMDCCKDGCACCTKDKAKATS